MNARHANPTLPASIAAALPLPPQAEARRLHRILAYLDRCGATYEPCARFPGWFQARWSDPANFDHACRWACSTAHEDPERLYALAFQARAERALS
jgi:hypothetical protein